MTGIGFVRSSRLGFANFWRNRWLSLAATLVVTLMLFTASVFAVQSAVIFRTTEALKQKIDLVVFFTDAATDDQIQALRAVVANRIDVAAVVYISKEKAFQIFNARPVSSAVKQLVTPEDNPLPRSLEIRATDPSHLPAISSLLNQPDYQSIILAKSDQDASQQQLIQNLTDTARITERNGLVLSGIFFLIAILMVFNTTRIVVHARSEEIELMRLVGATEGFIRWPFILEGILYGTLGAAFATGLLALFLSNDLLSATPLLSITGLLSGDMFQYFQRYFWIILGGQVGIGIFVCATATLGAIYRKVRR